MRFVTDNYLWIATALVSGALLLWPSIRGRAGGVASLSPVQATLLINREDAVLVDIREQDEFVRGHIPNSRHIPLTQFEKRIGELDPFKGRPVIINCHSGHRSHSACGALRRRGFEKVFSLDGGVSAWEQAGLPLTTR
ncbi:MAG TPA: rhodanese-like domain-containing protein [Rhodocyclaceae bacterium]|nr:MAG: sulfurtransferase [Betaproteobacteria bacterium CG2_30_68_42]PIX74821.1 MAG: rhodanese-like domain-containing protein [Rhodocyclales bacterium CG_4_10_14_3_um_filter_68_10]PJA56375.1 MAG: rhodanese-like domain-containing protein [Rhodocyclales bacterium CG_4_9_14_3_um_filter_68_10]HCX34621.1 rhodanese-like domain-containing protein [Rhodocyclaceae bacterium]